MGPLQLFVQQLAGRLIVCAIAILIGVQGKVGNAWSSSEELHSTPSEEVRDPLIHLEMSTMVGVASLTINTDGMAYYVAPWKQEIRSGLVPQGEIAKLITLAHDRGFVDLQPSYVYPPDLPYATESPYYHLSLHLNGISKGVVVEGHSAPPSFYDLLEAVQATAEALPRVKRGEVEQFCSVLAQRGNDERTRRVRATACAQDTVRWLNVDTRLTGLSDSGAYPIALIGEAQVSVGEMVAGWKVVQIKPDGVVAERDGVRQFVPVGQVLDVDYEGN